jgi:hypothetical protein
MSDYTHVNQPFEIRPGENLEVAMIRRIEELELAFDGLVIIVKQKQQQIVRLAGLLDRAMDPLDDLEDLEL